MIGQKRKFILLAERSNIRTGPNKQFNQTMFNKKPTNGQANGTNLWARPEMQVTFRAEIMPGKDREERTFRVREVRSNGRVTLHDFPDEHLEGEFEPLNFKRNTAK
ncbi:MAG: hypothetical protein ACJ72Z_03185 [Pyrinomonadaceae bacterium]